MFHAKPLNQSGYVQQPPQQQAWPLTPQEHNNLRASQNGVVPTVQVKFYLPDDEIRRSQIPTNCTLQQVTDQIKKYASVADKDLLLAWNDDQNEWIRFDTDSEFNDAMNHAKQLLSANGVFKIQAKEGKSPKKQQVVQPEPVKQPEPVVQPPIQPVQPVQPVTRPVQPPVQQPIQPIQPVQPQPQPQQPPLQPFFPQPQQPPMTRPGMQPPVMAFQPQFQPQFQPMTMNQPMSMNQPQFQPMTTPSSSSSNMPVPRNMSPFGNVTQPPVTTTPTRTLNSSVTMQQPHPLNASFGSPVSQPVQSPIQPTTTQSPPQVQPQSNIDPQQLITLRSFGFPVTDEVLIKVLQESNGDINVAVGKMLEQ